MNDVVGLRPFVPARDFAVSLEFYESLGFSLLHKDDTIAILTCGGADFILQNYYAQAYAENCMMQLSVRDVDGWWASLDVAALTRRFAVKQPVFPVMQPWGLKVGFLFDPSGVLWHVTEEPA